ncbi:MAG: C4-type zinc ribbon domain-containing protein [Acidobacteriota bacterium]
MSKIPVERENAENEFKTQAAEFLALQTKHEQKIAERKQLEFDLATAQEHHEKFKQDLMRVTNEKEYSTALREIDVTKKQVNTYETEILKGLEEIEKFDEQLKTLAPDVEQKRHEVDQFLATLDKEVQECEQALIDLNTKRSGLITSFPRSQLATYERMSKAKRGQALSEIRDGVCSACRVKVRPKVFSDVRKGDQMITCENCGRILYYRPDSNQSVETVTS